MSKYLIFFLLFISCIKEDSRTADNYYEKNNFNKAIELYNKVIELKPNDIKSIYRRARSYEELKKYDLSFKDFNRVLKLDKNNSNATLSIAIHHIRKSNYELAEMYSNKAIKINSDLYQSYFTLGRSLQYQGKFLDAIQAFNTSISKPSVSTLM